VWIEYNESGDYCVAGTALIAGLLKDGAHLVGHSYGAVIALYAAALRPDAVRSLTVSEPGCLRVAAGDSAVDAQIAHGDSFHNDRHPDLKADYVLANPPFNDSDWRGELLKNDKRWVYGVPPAGNANFAWVQHFIYHLAPTGLAGFVLANSSMSSNQSGEGEIRKAIIEADLVDCMVALPGQLFYATQIPVCLWFIARNKKNGRFRDRRGQTLFFDARGMGSMVNRVHRELTDEDVAKIASTYHAWRGDNASGDYSDVPGFCKAVQLETLRKNNYVLTPGRYVGAEAVYDDDEGFEGKMKVLTTALRRQQAEAGKLDNAITSNLEELGYGR